MTAPSISPKDVPVLQPGVCKTLGWQVHSKDRSAGICVHPSEQIAHLAGVTPVNIRMKNMWELEQVAPENSNPGMHKTTTTEYEPHEAHVLGGNRSNSRKEEKVLGRR